MVKITRVDMGRATLEVTDEGLVSRDFIMEDDEEKEKFNPHKEKALVDPNVLNHINSQSNDLFFMLKLGDIPTIKRWQDHAKEALQGNNIEWNDSDNFHVTLVFVPDISASETLHLTMGVDVAHKVPLIIDGFGTFSTERGDESNTLYLSVKKTPELAVIQANLYSFVTSEGMATSPFSIPEDWIPHITLASSEKPFDEAAFPNVGGMAVGAEAIEASVDFEAIAISEKFNPHHVPAGSPEGGQFTSAIGAGALSIWPTAQHEDRTELNSSIAFEEHAMNLGISVDEYIDELTKHVEKQVENANVAVRVTEDVLMTILDDGRFKNQHETETSRGYLDTSMRAEIEDKVWGEGREIQERPIYGYLYNQSQPRAVGQYGDIIVILNREVVEDRTTFTVGDSLHAMEVSIVAPRPIGSPDYLAIVGNSRDGLRSFPASGGGDHIYYEAQIHGGVSISDIKEVRLTRFLGSYDPELIAQLKANDIPVIFGQPN